MSQQHLSRQHPRYSSPAACRSTSTALPRHRSDRPHLARCRDRPRRPMWCSVDLRDGNQALIDPMSPARKRKMFDLLVRMGYKEIEVGFPSASQTDFDFVRELIEQGLIPGRRHDPGADPGPRASDRAHVRVDRGCQRARSCTCTTRRRRCSVVSCSGWTATASRTSPSKVRGCARSSRKPFPGPTSSYEYSPESFTGTELDYAAEVCNAVNEVWEATADRKVIINLPATVEMATPNVYADQIEWMHRHLANRENVGDLVAAPAQRPRHRGRGRRAGLPGRRRPHRGHAVRQR